MRRHQRDAPFALLTCQVLVRCHPRSHIAEEVTLDRCVQRLRQRLSRESWEKKRTNSYSAKMGERVPSFFTSPSLVNLGGLGVGDQTVLSSVGDEYELDVPGNVAAAQAAQNAIPSGHINEGWGGLGVQGNRSAWNLTRSHSSGFFIDEEEPAMEIDSLAFSL